MKDILKAVVFGGLFAVPFLALYVDGDYFFPYITGKNFWFRIIVDVTVVAWVILALLDAKYRPKISGITISFGILLVIMFFANLFGLHPSSSFWSNFERMDGYVSLVHAFLYMLVLGSVLHTKQLWQRLLTVSLIVALLVALYGLAQYGGLVSGGGRIDSRLGNAAYMAVYMLFHIFTAFWLLVETKNHLHKWFFGLSALLFIFVLIETGTRGTALGLVVGVMVMVAYIGLFGKQFAQYRKYAIGVLIFMLIGISALWLARDSSFVQSNGNLSRIANISFSDLNVRGIIWHTAWEGIKERPLLGYGQSNFNYVFNENYDPRLYGQEQWFDRSHNIFMDWLVTGGILGLIAYLSLFLWCLWYLLIRPLIRPDDTAFTVLERGVLLGILAGYFTHNLVVFDNIISYIFFAMILGLITARVGVVPRVIERMKVEPSLVGQLVAPIGLVLLVSVFYYWHLPGMATAHDLITAYRESDLSARLQVYERALARNTFARQEVTEQLAQQSMSIMQSQEVSAEIKQAYASTTEVALTKLAEWKPNDARVHVFIGSYFRSIGDFDRAAKEMARASELSPLKQSIIHQQGFVEMSRGAYEAMIEYFREAMSLAENNLQAREYYLAGLLFTGETESVDELLNVADENEKKLFWEQLAKSDFVTSAALQNDRTDLLIKLFDYRLEVDSPAGEEWRGDPQNWASLGYLYYKVGSTTEAIEVLNRGADAIPGFASTASCFAENIENGREPQAGCQ